MFAVEVSLSRHCCGLIGLDLPIVRTPIRTMTHTMTAALAERARLGVTLALFATSRGIEAAGSGDRRYAYAADAIKRIAGTLDQVGDEVLMRLATINEISNGTLSSLMSARLAKVGFALPTYPDAKAFFQPLVEQADAILHRARQRLN